MRFINKGESVNIRIGKLNEDFYWVTIKTGETMDLPEQVGIDNCLEKVIDVTLESKQVKPETTEGQIGNKKVETKQFEDYTPDDLFFKELTKIKGIGPKMARDIVTWGTKEKLIEVIKMRGSLPFRDDIEMGLYKKYGE